MASNRYVRPAGRGWEVVKEGHRRGMLRASTKREAVAHARELVRREGGGEIRILNSSGKMTEADQVPPAKRRAA